MFKRLISFLFFCGVAFTQCTIGLATASATADGRPLAFKTRDITSWNTEFKTVNSTGFYSYTINNSVGSTTAWMGVNEVGFGIVQSAAYNLSSGTSGLGNGTLMNFTLARCSSLADFVRILDSTNVTGRATAANYAVIDSSGNGAVFEVGRNTYARYDPDSLGIVVRANFAYIGGSGRVGQNRMERAYQLMGDAIRGDSLDTRFIAKYVISDLLYPGQNPYPLPWTGSFPGMPAGYVNTGAFQATQTICNYNSRSAGVIMGPHPSGDLANSVMFCYFGQPVLSIPIPIFPASRSQPPQTVGNPAQMCALAHSKSDSAFGYGSYDYYLNTAFLKNTSGGGCWNYTLPTLDWVIDTVLHQIFIWEVTMPAGIFRSDFQNAVAERVVNSYISGTPLLAEKYTSMPEMLTLDFYPNPFNASLNIVAPGDADIEIFDINGRQIAVLEKGSRIWTPDKNIPTGIYSIRARTGDKTISKKVAFIK